MLSFNVWENYMANENEKQKIINLNTMKGFPQNSQVLFFVNFASHCSEFMP